MKIISVNLYSFDELDSEVQEEVLNDFYDINIDFDWYNFVYDDAEEIGLKIKEFDLDRFSIKAEFLESAFYTANKIVSSHGQNCETYKDAQNYLTDYKAIEKETDLEENDIETEEIDFDFLKTISEDYLSILRKELEYRTSEEAIKDTIKANEYWFTKDGKLY